MQTNGQHYQTLPSSAFTCPGPLYVAQRPQRSSAFAYGIGQWKLVGEKDAMHACTCTKTKEPCKSANGDGSRRLARKNEKARKKGKRNRICRKRSRLQSAAETDGACSPPLLLGCKASCVATESQLAAQQAGRLLSASQKIRKFHTILSSDFGSGDFHTIIPKTRYIMIYCYVVSKQLDYTETVCAALVEICDTSCGLCRVCAKVFGPAAGPPVTKESCGQ